MMKLNSLEVKPNGVNGWGLPAKDFGESITQLYGPNGIGKTPVIEFIVFALGNNVTFRTDIYDRCGEVVLSCVSLEGAITIRRRIRKNEFYAEIESDGRTVVYANEKDFSEFLIPWSGFSYPTLVHSNGKSTNPYMSTLLPLVYLNQDYGYARFYATSTGSVFIQEQPEEMLRIYFGLHPRNSYENKKRQIELKDEIEATTRKVVGLEGIILNLKKDVKDARFDVLNLELENLQAELDSLLGAREVKTEAVEVLARAISEQKARARTISGEIIDLEFRIKGTEKIEHEVEAEIETLGLNVEARDIFLEICRNETCGLFEKSAEAFGKSLLYLKDQIKDLETGKIKWRARIDELKQERAAIEEGIKVNGEALSRTAQSPASKVLSDTVSMLTGKIYEIAAQKKQLEILGVEQQSYFDLLTKRESLSEEYESFSKGSKMGIRQAEIREAVRQKLVEWMDILDTQNVSREITLDSSFIPSFGSEHLASIHGSTKVRCVLAFHAAIFEVQSKYCPELSLPLILDTPKQQELETSALAAYIQGLSALSKRTGTQIIFSTTEYHYEGGEKDLEWTPTFDGPKQRMFLGAIPVNAG